MAPTLPFHGGTTRLDLGWNVSLLDNIKTVETGRQQCTCSSPKAELFLNCVTTFFYYPPMSLYDNPISFSDFCRLLTSIRTVKPLRKGQTWRGKCPKELQNLQAWVSTTRGLFEGHAGLPLGTITIFFRLFFPEEGVRRR